MQKRTFELGQNFPPDLLSHVEGLFRGENLIQMILHAHLLVERALILRIAERLARPEVLKGGKYSRFSFHQKATLYMGLTGADPEFEKRLFGLNSLRNGIAHQLLDDEKELVSKCLPWAPNASPPNPVEHVWVIAAMLLFELRAIKSITTTAVD